MSSTSRQRLCKKSYTAVIANDVASEVFTLGASYNDLIGELRVVRTGGTVAVKLQHSSDLLVWHDLVAFSTVSATANELKEPTGKTLQYVRVVVTTTVAAVDLSVEVFLNYRMIKG